MPESRIVIECPLCRCRMEVPRQGGRSVYNCRNGHRFLRSLPHGPSCRRPARQATMFAFFLLLLVLALVIAIALAAQHWPSRVPFMRID